MAERVVVVGAGLAAAKVVENLRKEGYEGSIALVGDEAYRPYERPGLSKEVLQHHAEADSLFVHESGFYAASGVATHFGDGAVALDRAGHAVRLASGLQLSYDALVLATGSRARTVDLPGAHLDGVRTLRTVDDGLALRAALRPGRRIVLVGGGWIGLEAAAAAALAGCSVTILEAGPLPLQRILGERLARHIADLHAAHGVDVRTSVKVEAFEGAGGRVTGVRSDGQLLPADVVLVGIGAIPNTALAEEAGLAVDNGLLVDERLRTEDAAIWAAGDVANAHNALLGRRVRVEHWDNARRQGRLAALSILDRPNVYDWQPYFYPDQYDFSMEYVGQADGDAEVVLRGDESGPFLAFWLTDGRIAAAMNVNTPKTNAALRKIVGLTIDPHRLADPAVPLEELAHP